MTENEAIRDLDIIRFNPHWDELVNEEYWQELMEMATKALEEVQQYRAIGTPEECRAAVAVKKEVQDIVDRLEELKEEKAIGSHKVMIKEAIEIVRGEADA